MTNGFARFSISSSQRRISSLTTLLMAVLIVIIETPILSRRISNLLYYGLIAMLFLSSVSIFAHLSNRKRNSLYSVLLYLMLIGFYRVLGISSASLSYYSTTVKFLLLFVFMVCFFEIYTKRQKVFLLSVSLVSILVTMIDNVRLYLIYGSYRFVHLFQVERFTTNSVNTQFITGLLFFSAVMVVCFLKIKNKLLKTLALVLAVFSVVFSVVIAQRAIVLVLWIVMIPWLIFANHRNGRSGIVITLLAILVLLLALVNYEQILTGIGNLTGSSRIQTRIAQLIDFSNRIGDMDESGSMYARLNLILTSLKTWSSSILRMLFGAGDHRETNEIIGNHSHLVDELARYGLVGFSVLVLMLCRFFREIRVEVALLQGSSLEKQMKIILLFYVIRGLVGGMFDPTIGIQIFMVLPIVFSLLNEKQSGLPKSGER